MNLTYLVLTKIGILSAVIFGYSNANAELSNEQKRLQAASAPTCGNFRNILESYLAGLPKDCKENSDCKAQFLHIDSCAAGYFFNKKFDANLDEKLKGLQIKARVACQAEYAQRPACSPQTKEPVCNEGRCVSKKYLPVVLSKETLKQKYRFALIRPGCAPSDAPSWMMTVFTTKVICSAKVVYPFIHLNWWSRRPQPPIKSKFSLKSENMKDLSASICASQTSCVSSKRIEIEFDQLDSKSGKGSIHLDLPDGQIQDSEFEVEICEGSGAPCG